MNSKKMIAAISIALIPTLLHAETYYVAPNGNDANKGDFENPFLTLDQAVARLKVGDTMVVSGGVYTEPVRIGASGTPAQPITVTVAEDAAVVLDGSEMPPDTDLVVITGSHIVFEGFTVINAKRAGINLWSTENVTVRENTVQSSFRSGIWAGTDGRVPSRKNVIESNVVYDNALINAGRELECGLPSGIEVFSSDDVVVRNNTIYENHGPAISILSSSGGMVKGNRTYDNYSVEIYFEDSLDARAADNIIGISRNPDFFRFGEPARKFVIAANNEPLMCEARL